jgi:hypothetical protein
MNNRQHIQKKHPSQSTYTPVQNLYQTRAFDIQQQPSHSSSGQENVDNAFKPDPKTGKVNMTGYKYREKGGGNFVNFDYGFWDEASQSFWHANHSEPGMEVYQSTKEKFAKGYADFDRVIYCVAIAKNYDPQKAAKTP